MASTVTLAPHLQHALELMSRDMAVAPDALVNQAVFAWLRINGYVVAGAAVAPAAEAPVAAPLPPAVPPSPTGASAARLAEIAADLEALTRSTPDLAPAGDPLPAEEEAPEAEAPPAPDAEEAPAPAEEEAPPGDDEEEAPPEDEDPFAEAPEEVPAAAAPPEDEARAAEAPEDEAGLDGNTGEVEQPPEDSTVVLRSAPIALYLEREGEDPIRVSVDRFIIGRGPHCDLVIDSPRVSREHVALTRSGIRYFLEDLNSSNGTWFNGEKVTRRELESGDLINLGNEPVRFILRGT